MIAKVQEMDQFVELLLLMVSLLNLSCCTGEEIGWHIICYFLNFHFNGSSNRKFKHDFFP